MVDRRLAHGVLALTGATIAHAVAYGLLSTGVGATGHTATDTMFVTLISLSFAVVGISIVRAAISNGSFVTIGLARLALVQTGLFVTQELVEAVGSGETLAAAVGASSLVVGIVVQPAVAFVLLFLVRRAEQLGAGFATTAASTPRHGVVISRLHAPAVVPCAADTGNRNGSRAPPR